MKIGCPKEIKPQEFRVGLTPNARKRSYRAWPHCNYTKEGRRRSGGFTTLITPQLVRKSSTLLKRFFLLQI